MSAFGSTRPQFWSRLAICSTGGAIIIHLGAGWVDARRLQLLPIGEIIVVVMYTWIAALIVTGVSVVALRGKSNATWLAFAISLAANALLWGAFHPG